MKHIKQMHKDPALYKGYNKIEIFFTLNRFILTVNCYFNSFVYNILLPKLNDNLLFVVNQKPNLNKTNFFLEFLKHTFHIHHH